MKVVPILIVLFYWFLCTSSLEVYVHMMPWFETKDTNNGTWGQHWTMANDNPDNIIDGKQDIASFYHPKIGPYASGDPDVIDWQLGVMKAAGIAGVFIDWPGTTEAYDYPKNKENCEAIIEGTERAGLKFAIVYEDNNLKLASVPDVTGQAVADMEYIQNNYFTKDNYVMVNGAPLLMDFGPQVVLWKQWDDVLAPLDPKPTFLTLWNQHQQGGTYCQGEFAWVSVDFMQGLERWWVRIIFRLGTTNGTRLGTLRKMFRSRSELPTQVFNRFTPTGDGPVRGTSSTMVPKPSNKPGIWPCNILTSYRFALGTTTQKVPLLNLQRSTTPPS
jgi:hypothetical protein